MTVAFKGVSEQVCNRCVLTQRDRTTIAQVLTWDMYNQIQVHKVITIAVNNGVVQVKLTSGRAALLSVDTFRLILKQQWQQLDEDVVHIEHLEQKLDQHSNKIKIAHVGKTYLKGQGSNLFSTFYPVGRNWNWQIVNDKPSFGVKIAITALEKEVAA